MANDFVENVEKNIEEYEVSVFILLTLSIIVYNTHTILIRAYTRGDMVTRSRVVSFLKWGRLVPSPRV